MWQPGARSQVQLCMLRLEGRRLEGAAELGGCEVGVQAGGELHEALVQEHRSGGHLPCSAGSCTETAAGALPMAAQLSWRR